MEKIRNIFRDKGFSEETLQYLENAINEFGEVFGSFLSKEELIERCKKNIDKIEFVDEIGERAIGKRTIGRYYTREKKISIVKKLSDEMLASTFFHEFLHAIVSDGENSGFSRCYEEIDEDFQFIFGEGWNEGFVQMMTQERDKKIANKKIQTGYPVLTECVEKFSNFLGREELIGIYFNQADEFLNFLQEKIEVEWVNFDRNIDFLINFDVIHEYEGEIYKHRNKHGTNLLWRCIGIDRDIDIDNNELKKAQEEILQVYLDLMLKREIKNTEELQDIFDNINEMSKIFSKTISAELIQRLIEECNSDVLNDLCKLNPEIQFILENGIKFKKFTDADVQKKLELIGMEDEEFIDSFYGLYFELSIDYIPSIMTELYSGLIDFKDNDMHSCLMYFKYIAKYIDKNNLSFENLKIKYNEYEFGGVFELYNLQENCDYEKISTIYIDKESPETTEYTEVGIEKLLELKKDYSTEIFEAYEDKHGNYIVYDDKGQFFKSTEYNEIYRPTKKQELDSVNEIRLETLEKRIESLTKQLQKIEEREELHFMLKATKDDLKEKIDSKNRIVESIRKASRKKITRSQIEDITINGSVTMQSLQSAMEDLATEEKKLENEGENK